MANDDKPLDFQQFGDLNINEFDCHSLYNGIRDNQAVSDRNLMQNGTRKPVVVSALRTPRQGAFQIASNAKMSTNF
jgi:hypothetical protein